MAIDQTGTGGIPNSDGGTPADLFGAPIPRTTGANGSAGVTAAAELPDTAWRVPAVAPYDSVQSGDVNLTGVGRDDVNMMNQSELYSTGRDPLTGVDHSFLGATGAGEGTASTPHHPNSQARP